MTNSKPEQPTKEPTGSAAPEVPVPPASASHPRPATNPRPSRIPTAELIDNELLDIQRLNESTTDPNRHYAWVRDDEHGSAVRRREMEGYEIETYREGGPKPVANRGHDAGDNVIRMGDTVLMSRPKELHDRATAARFARSERRLNSTTEELRRKAQEKGINLIGDKEMP